MLLLGDLQAALCFQGFLISWWRIPPKKIICSFFGPQIWYGFYFLAVLWKKGSWKQALASDKSKGGCGKLWKTVCIWTRNWKSLTFYLRDNELKTDFRWRRWRCCRCFPRGSARLSGWLEHWAVTTTEEYDSRHSSSNPWRDSADECSTSRQCLFVSFSIPLFRRRERETTLDSLSTKC